MFDIRLNDEQRAFQQLAREFAEKEIKPVALDLDSRPNWEDRIPWDVLKKGSRLGFRTFVLQEENGGAGASDHLTACLVAEELAAADIGTAYYFMLTARRARDWFELRMTQEQRDYFIPKIPRRRHLFHDGRHSRARYGPGLRLLHRNTRRRCLPHARGRAARRLLGHQRR